MFLPHHALPVAKFQVGCDDHGNLLVEGRAVGKRRWSPSRLNGMEAELIEHQQFLLAEGGQQAREFHSCCATIKSLTQGGHIVETHPSPLTASGQGQSGGHVVLPQAGVPIMRRLGVREACLAPTNTRASDTPCTYSQSNWDFEHRQFGLGNAAFHSIGIALGQAPLHRGPASSARTTSPCGRHPERWRRRCGQTPAAPAADSFPARCSVA